MYQKLFKSLFLLLFTFPLLAIDINETTEIIEEASEATQTLQEDFSALIEEGTVPSVTINSIETSTPSENNVTAQEVLIVEELNSSMETPMATELNISEASEPTKVLTPLEETNRSNIIPIQAPIISQQENIIPNLTIDKSIETTIELNTTKIDSKDINTSNTLHEDEEGVYTRGMVIFKTKFKAVCKMTGEEFAKNYTQEDWDDIYDNNEFEKVVYELCPAMKGKYEKKWTKDLYQFSLKYASDSDEIPEC